MNNSIAAVASDPRLKAELATASYPLIFATISGAHLYGFPSEDSDFDLRGVHVLPQNIVLALESKDETVEKSTKTEGFELDLVTHDAKKFFLLMLKKNGYVLEQLYSPLVVHGKPELEELRSIGRNCITRFHSHHYLGFSESQWRLFASEERRRVKPLLYVFRVLLTGIYLMESGRIEANLAILNEHFNLPYIPELIARKLNGGEQVYLSDHDLSQYEKEYQRLRVDLENARDKSSLPDLPSAKGALNDLLLRIRIKYGANQICNT